MDVSEILNRATDVRDALTRTLERVTEVLGLEAGWVWLTDPDTGQFYSAATHRLPPFLEDPVRMTGHRCVCIDAFRAGHLAPRNVDVIECSRLRPASGKQSRGLRWHATVPIYIGDRGIGILNVTGPERRALAEEELRLLSSIADQIGVAVERARLAEEGRRLARAQERTRLAREIHDTLAQGLTGIALRIEGALLQLDPSATLVRERLEDALRITRESLEEARASVLDLRLAPLAGQPLAEALAALGRRFTSDTGIPVDVRADVVDLPLRVEAELYRIVQEALTNVRKHSRAHHVRVVLKGGDAVRLRVEDDGWGFDPRAVPEGRHGLLGMRERARLAGGTLRLDSGPGRGTRVSVRLAPS